MRSQLILLNLNLLIIEMVLVDLFFYLKYLNEVVFSNILQIMV